MLLPRLPVPEPSACQGLAVMRGNPRRVDSCRCHGKNASPVRRRPGRTFHATAAALASCPQGWVEPLDPPNGEGAGLCVFAPRYPHEGQVAAPLSELRGEFHHHTTQGVGARHTSTDYRRGYLLSVSPVATAAP